MEFKDISLGKPRNTSNTLENLGKEKLDSIKKTIAEINELIDSREELSKKIFDEAEKEKRSIDNILLEVEAKNSVSEIDDVREKIAFRQKRVELSELQLNEKISCWKDVALLKKELRENQRELNEKQGRLEMFGKILEE
jgi:hypothetical protein